MAEAPPTALGPVANTDTKLLIYGLFQKGRVLAQDAIAISKDVGVHTKMPLNVRNRVISPTGIARKNGVSRNQAQTPARKCLGA